MKKKRGVDVAPPKKKKKLDDSMNSELATATNLRLAVPQNGPSSNRQ
jgi:hypothetical protein